MAFLPVARVLAHGYPSVERLSLACSLLAAWYILSPGGGRSPAVPHPPRARGARFRGAMGGGIAFLVLMGALYWPLIARGYFLPEAFDQLQIFRIREFGWHRALWDHSYEFHAGRYRPVEMAMWKILCGCLGLHARAYLLWGVGLIALAAHAVFACARILVGSPRRAAAAALVLAVHPISFFRAAEFHYTTILTTALGLYAWCYFMRYARGEGRRHGAVSLLFLSGAVLTKESAFSMPLLFLVWALLEGRTREGLRPPFRKTAACWAPFPLAMIGIFAFRWAILGSAGAWRPSHVLWGRSLRAVFIGMPRSYLALYAPTLFDPSRPVALALWSGVWAGAIIGAVLASGPVQRRAAFFAMIYGIVIFAPECSFAGVSPYSMRYYAAFPGFCIAIAALIPGAREHPALSRAVRGAVALIVSGFLASVVLFCIPAHLEEAAVARRVTEGMSDFLCGLAPGSRSGTVFLVRGLSGAEMRNCHDLWVKAVGGPALEECLVLPLAAHPDEQRVWCLIPEGMWEKIWTDPRTEELSWCRKDSRQMTLRERTRAGHGEKIAPVRRGPSLLNLEGWAPTPGDAALMELPVICVEWNGGRPFLLQGAGVVPARG